MAKDHRLKGPNHRDTLRASSRLANTLYAAGRYLETTRWFRDILTQSTAGLGPDHPDTLRSKSSLADAFFATGYPRQVTHLHQDILSAGERVLGVSYVRTQTSQD